MGYIDIQFSNDIEIHLYHLALVQMHYKRTGVKVTYSESENEEARNLVEICREWMAYEKDKENV